MEVGFDNDLYVEKQSKKIIERIDAYGKLYLEFGGKLFDDLHASRVLPGFEPDAKTTILKKMMDKLEVILCISAADIERRKQRADYGITYDMDVLRHIDKLRSMGILVSSVVITQYESQNSAKVFKKKLENRNETVYIHKMTKGYPTDVDIIVSEEGYGKNPYIETTRPLVVVTAPGPGSGKLGTCLGQLYHEMKRGQCAGYAKFETFPVWNLPLHHPVNKAYEAATADLNDVNMIDHFHLEAYGVSTVNYNRDIEVFPVVKRILEKITGKPCEYKSPTDMGVNMLGYFISDDNVCRDAAKQEILRRFFESKCAVKQGLMGKESLERVHIMMNELGITPWDRPVVRPAVDKSEETGMPALAIGLKNGKIVVGRDKKLLTNAASAVLNSIKELSDIKDPIKLLPPVVIEPITQMKKENLLMKDAPLNLEETLIALSISAVTNPMVEYAMSKLKDLRDCEAHSSVILTKADEMTLKKLGLRVTAEAEFATGDLYEG